MTRAWHALLAAAVTMALVLATGCSSAPGNGEEESPSSADAPRISQTTQLQDDSAAPASNSSSVPETYRGFELDQTLDGASGVIHYNIMVPESLDASSPVSLFVTLPGYQGLYFQGVAENLKTEDFAYTAQSYCENMVVLAPQLGDWGQRSADQTIELVEFIAARYGAMPENTFIEGYSGGGETLTLVLGTKPDLFARALVCSTQWDGDLHVLARARVPVCMVIGESDEYYGSGSLASAAQELRGIYAEQGLSDAEIDRLVVLDVKDGSYFTSQGASNQHGGGAALFAHDESVMGWLFGE